MIIYYNNENQKHLKFYFERKSVMKKQNMFEEAIAPYAIIPGKHVTNGFGEVIENDFENIIFYNGYMASIRYLEKSIIITPRDYNGFVELGLLKNLKGYNKKNGSVKVTDPEMIDFIFYYIKSQPHKRGVKKDKKLHDILSITYKEMAKNRHKVGDYLFSMVGKELIETDDKNEFRFKINVLLMKYYGKTISQKGRIMSIDLLNRQFETWKIPYRIEKKETSGNKTVWVVVEE